MLKYFGISAKNSTVSIMSLIINLLFYTFFEIFIFGSIKKFEIWDYLSTYPLLYHIAEFIIPAQAIVLFAVSLYLAFRQKGIMLYDEYMHIQDGILLFRLFYCRKLKYEDIETCQIRRCKDLKMPRYLPHSAAVPGTPIFLCLLLGYFFNSFSCFEPFMGMTNSQFVVEIITYNHKHIILEVKNPEEFVIDVNGEEDEASEDN